MRVISSDTVRVEMNRREETVRLLGISEPETFGSEATTYTEQLVSAGDTILVELDEETRDYDDRLLAYLYLPTESGTWHYEGRTYTQLNHDLALAGLANTLSFDPNVRYKDVYQQAVFLAARDERGMWE